MFSFPFYVSWLSSYGQKAIFLHLNSLTGQVLAPKLSKTGPLSTIFIYFWWVFKMGRGVPAAGAVPRLRLTSPTISFWFIL